MDDKTEDAITAPLPKMQIKKINPNRPVAEIIQDLSKRLPEHLLSKVPRKWFEAQREAQDRENRECRKRHYPLDLLPYDVPHKYIPWYNAVRILNHYAPGWIGEIRNIAVPGKSANTFVTVVYRITVKGSDGEVCREASATSTMDYGDHSVYFSPVQNAEREAFCKACVLFGLGLYLYHSPDSPPPDYNSDEYLQLPVRKVDRLWIGEWIACTEDSLVYLNFSGLEGRRRRSWSSDSIGSDYDVSTEDDDETVSVESGSGKSSPSAETSTRVRGVLSGLSGEAPDESNSELTSERCGSGRTKRRKLKHPDIEENSEESEEDSSDEEGSGDEIFNQLGNIQSNLHSSPISSRVLPSSVSPPEASQISSARTLLPKGTWAPSALPRLTPSQLSAHAKQYKKLRKRMVRSGKAKHGVKASWKEEEVQVRDQRTDAWTSLILTPRILFLEGSGSTTSNLDIMPAVVSPLSELRAERAEAALISDADNGSMVGSTPKVKAARQSRSLSLVADRRNRGRQSFPVKDKGPKAAKSLRAEISTSSSRASQTETGESLSTSKVRTSRRTKSKRVKNWELEKSSVQSRESIILDEVVSETAEESTLSIEVSDIEPEATALGSKDVEFIQERRMPLPEKVSPKDDGYHTAGNSTPFSTGLEPELEQTPPAPLTRAQREEEELVKATGLLTHFSLKDISSTDDGFASSGDLTAPREFLDVDSLNGVVGQSVEVQHFEEVQLEKRAESTFEDEQDLARVQRASSSSKNPLEYANEQSERNYTIEAEVQSRRRTRDHRANVLKNKRPPIGKSSYEEMYLETSEESESWQVNRDIRSFGDHERTHVKEKESRKKGKKTVKNRGNSTESGSTSLRGGASAAGDSERVDSLLFTGEGTTERRIQSEPTRESRELCTDANSSSLTEPLETNRGSNKMVEVSGIQAGTDQASVSQESQIEEADRDSQHSRKSTAWSETLETHGAKRSEKLQTTQLIEDEQRQDETRTEMSELSRVQSGKVQKKRKKPPIYGSKIGGESRGSSKISGRYEDAKTKRHKEVERGQSPRKRGPQKAMRTRAMRRGSGNVDEVPQLRNFSSCEDLEAYGERLHPSALQEKPIRADESQANELSTLATKGNAMMAVIASVTSSEVRDVVVTTSDIDTSVKFSQEKEHKFLAKCPQPEGPSLYVGGRETARDDDYDTGTETLYYSGDSDSDTRQRSNKIRKRKVKTAEDGLSAKDSTSSSESSESDAGETSYDVKLVNLGQENERKDSAEPLDSERYFQEGRSSNYVASFEVGTEPVNLSEKSESELEAPRETSMVANCSLGETTLHTSISADQIQEVAPINAVAGETQPLSEVCEADSDAPSRRVEIPESGEERRMDVMEDNKMDHTGIQNPGSGKSIPHRETGSFEPKVDVTSEKKNQGGLEQPVVEKPDLESEVLQMETKTTISDDETGSAGTFVSLSDRSGSKAQVALQRTDVIDCTKVALDGTTLLTGSDPTGQIQRTAPIDAVVEETHPLSGVREADSDAPSRRVEILESATGEERRMDMMDRTDIENPGSDRKIPHGETRSFESKVDVTSKRNNKSGLEQSVVEKPDLKSEVLQMETNSRTTIFDDQAGSAGTFLSFGDRPGTEAQVASQRTDLIESTKVEFDETTPPTSSDLRDQIQGSAPINAIVGETPPLSEVSEADSDAPSRRVEILESVTRGERRMDIIEDNKMDQTDIENIGSERKIPHGETRSVESEVDVTSERNNKGGWEQHVVEKLDLESDVLQMETNSKTTIFDDQTGSLGTFVSFSDRSGTVELELDETTPPTSSDPKDQIQGTTPIVAVAEETQLISEVCETDSDAARQRVEITESGEERRMDIMEDNKMDKTDIENLGSESQIPHGDTRSFEPKVDVTSEKKNIGGLEQRVAEKPESEVLKMDTKTTIFDDQTGSTGKFVSFSERSGPEAQVVSQRTDVIESKKVEYSDSEKLVHARKVPHEKTNISGMEVYVIQQKMTEAEVEQSDARNLDAVKKVGQIRMSDEPNTSGIDDEFDVGETYISHSEEFRNEADVASQMRTDLAQGNKMESGANILFSESKLPGLESDYEKETSRALDIPSAHGLFSASVDMVMLSSLDKDVDGSQVTGSAVKLQSTASESSATASGPEFVFPTFHIPLESLRSKSEREGEALSASTSRFVTPREQPVPSESSSAQFSYEAEASKVLTAPSVVHELFSVLKRSSAFNVRSPCSEVDIDGTQLKTSSMDPELTELGTASPITQILFHESLTSESAHEKETSTVSSSSFATPPEHLVSFDTVRLETDLPENVCSLDESTSLKNDDNGWMTPASMVEIGEEGGTSSTATSSSEYASSGINVPLPRDVSLKTGERKETVRMLEISTEIHLFSSMKSSNSEGRRDPVTSSTADVKSIDSLSTLSSEVSTSVSKVSPPDGARPISDGTKEVVSVSRMSAEYELSSSMKNTVEERELDAGNITPTPSISEVEIDERRVPVSTMEVGIIASVSTSSPRIATPGGKVPPADPRYEPNSESGQIKEVRISDIVALDDESSDLKDNITKSVTSWTSRLETDTGQIRGSPLDTTLAVASTSSENFYDAKAKFSPAETLVSGEEEILTRISKTTHTHGTSSRLRLDTATSWRAKVDTRQLRKSTRDKETASSTSTSASNTGVRPTGIARVPRVYASSSPSRSSIARKMMPLTDAGLTRQSVIHEDSSALSTTYSSKFLRRSAKAGQRKIDRGRTVARFPQLNIAQGASSALKSSTPAGVVKIVEDKKRSTVDTKTTLSETYGSKFASPRGVSDAKLVNERKVIGISKNALAKGTSSSPSSYAGRVRLRSPRVEADIEHMKGRKDQLTSNALDFRNKARKVRDETKHSIEDFDSYTDTVTAAPLSNLERMVEERKIEDLSEETSSSELVIRDQTVDRRVSLTDVEVGTLIPAFQAASGGLKSSTLGADIHLNRVDVLDSSAQGEIAPVSGCKTYDNGVPLSRSDLETESGVRLGGVATGMVTRKSSHYGPCGLRKLTPLNLGLETAGGVMTVIIPRNTSVPVQRQQLISTHIDNQTELLVHIFEGERLWVRDNNMLGSFEVTGIALAPRGVPRIAVRFDIDAKGVLNVFLEGKKTIGSQTMKRLAISNVSVRPDKHKILEIIHDADKHKIEDEENRRSIELKDSLENYVYKMRNIVNDEKIARLLDPGDKEQMMAAVHAALEWLRVSNWFLYHQKQIVEFSEVDANRRKLQRICDPILERLFLDQGHVGKVGSSPLATHRAD